MIKSIIGYDIIGSIAIVKFSDKTSLKDKKEESKKIMLQHSNIRTVLEKTDKIRGKLRTYKTKYIAGKNTKETIHKEYSCLFKLNVEKCYFSPRLSNERIEISNKIKKIGKKKNILVMFAGVAPYSIVIAKNNKSSEIYSNELNKIACKYAEENIKINKTNNVQIIQGDAKQIKNLIKKYNTENKNFLSHKNLTKKQQGFSEIPSKYDIIVMPRAQLKDTFLKEAFSISKKGTIIFFREFCKQEEIREKIKNIGQEARIQKKKIKIRYITRTQEIAPYKFRYMIEFGVL